MLLVAIAFLGGLFTILSPCILPVVPFVFARADEPFATGRLPFFAGLALTFALATGLGVLGVVGAVQVSQYGRWVALAVFASFGAALLFPSIASRFALPLASLTDRLIARSASHGAERRVASALLHGAATGLLCAPCAGPVLGAILTGAALGGSRWHTLLALLAYAVGAACALGIVSRLGKEAMSALKRSLGIGEWMRRAIGALVLASVAAIALGLDVRALALIPGVPTDGIENRLVALLGAGRATGAQAQAARSNAGWLRVSLHASLPDEGRAPPLDGATAWLNSAPLSGDALRGKVTVVNFWTYSCINCLRTLPYLKAWADRYGKDGLTVVGVHTPEFGFEHDVGNVKRALSNLGIRYPVAVDNDYRIWQAFDNQYWPAFYIVDAHGRVRYHHFGEGGYREAEDVIRQLLADSGRPMDSQGQPPQAVQGNGAQAAADPSDIRSGETYVGYRQAQGFSSIERVVPDKAAGYTVPKRLSLNEWALGGQWNVGGEAAVPAASNARIAYRFHARDLHLVMGPAADGKPVRFRVTVDGAAPGASHGADVAPDGSGTISAPRLYQLVRQQGSIDNRTFEIEFLDPGAQVYSFTFG